MEEKGKRGKRPSGWERLIVWQNAADLRREIYQATKDLPRSEYRRISQMQDAARSVKQNIQEGYSRYSLPEYLQALNIARGSLGELMGDIDDCVEDSLISQELHDHLKSLARKTHYLLDRLLQSLRQMRKDNTWVKF